MPSSNRSPRRPFRSSRRGDGSAAKMKTSSTRATRNDRKKGKSDNLMLPLSQKTVAIWAAALTAHAIIVAPPRSRREDGRAVAARVPVRDRHDVVRGGRREDRWRGREYFPRPRGVGDLECRGQRDRGSWRLVRGSSRPRIPPLSPLARRARAPPPSSVPRRTSRPARRLASLPIDGPASYEHITNKKRRTMPADVHAPCEPVSHLRRPGRLDQVPHPAPALLRIPDPAPDVVHALACGRSSQRTTALGSCPRRHGTRRRPVHVVVV